MKDQTTKVDSFGYMENYLKKQNNFDYKTDTSKYLAAPCFKFSYPEKIRIKVSFKFSLIN